jgi:hypothetical protein
VSLGLATAARWELVIQLRREADQPVRVRYPVVARWFVQATMTVGRRGIGPSCPYLEIARKRIS